MNDSLFRQGPTRLSETDQKRRTDEVRAWTLRQNYEGRKLDPRILLRREDDYFGRFD